MTQNVEDLRVRRTRKLLQKALLEATAEKGFAHVTVSDIAERAMVNRATFYRHYQDKYDLLRRYIQELSRQIDTATDEGKSGGPPNPLPTSLPAGLVSLLKHLQANAGFYRVMLGRQGDPAFCAQSFRPFVEQGLRRMLSSQEQPVNPRRPPIDLTVSYVLHAGIGAIVWWLENDHPCPPEQLADWLYQLSLASLSVSFAPGGD